VTEQATVEQRLGRGERKRGETVDERSLARRDGDPRDVDDVRRRDPDAMRDDTTDSDVSVARDRHMEGDVDGDG
jgi:hypothetical protein